MEKKDEIVRIDLTPEQTQRVLKQTGKNAEALELRPARVADVTDRRADPSGRGLTAPPASFVPPSFDFPNRCTQYCANHVL